MEEEELGGLASAPASSGTAVAAPARGWEKRETDRRAKAWATVPPLGNLRLPRRRPGEIHWNPIPSFETPLPASANLICIQNNKEPRRLRLFDVTVVERSQ